MVHWKDMHTYCGSVFGNATAPGFSNRIIGAKTTRAISTLTGRAIRALEISEESAVA